MTKLYLANVLNLICVCFIIQILFTLLFNYPNENAEYTGRDIWIIFTIYLIYRLCKSLKTNFGKFIINLLLCFIILFFVSRYFTLFDIIEPRYYGFNGLLYNYLPTDLNYDIKKFMFWQTGVASEYNYEGFNYNLLVTFFTIPPIALIECFVKAIFPNLYVLLLIQFIVSLFKKSVLSWKTE